MLVHVYLIVSYYVQGGSGSVCVFTNPISLSIVMASLWVQRISNGCGHCALDVTSVVDNDTFEGKVYPSEKIKPVIDTLNENFLKYYSPAQEICVDETMVKGRCKGKVRMLKKPIK